MSWDFYWLLWSEFNLSLQSAAWDAQKAPRPGRSVCCLRPGPAWGTSWARPSAYPEPPERGWILFSSSLFPRKAVTTFSNLWWGASLLLPCANVALLPKQGRNGKKVNRAGKDHDKRFIFSIWGFFFFKYEIMWARERHELIEMRKSKMQMTKAKEKFNQCCP